ncbi:hypothetical protein D3H65_28375 [Paraflavitalea soli]|uniref:DUF4382 domain-containing protein n=1 Tax=Paraflavitalea soli TaxID=2315862 RepID=A0A3B7MWR9_9BACT|nr:hypothetical protein [Paraflavitalea soli]AXY77659.1 hypothetical protein D3H65_28375 [Paraflavitalea soli]
MKRSWIQLTILTAVLSAAACDKENDDLVTPLSVEQFPQVVVLSDEGDGGLEDEDAFSVKITLADRVDTSGKELGGKVVPLKEAVTVNFKVTDFKGFSKLSDYIKGAEAFYEIDDCTTSADEGIDIPLQFDVNTGIGTVTFPAGVEELEIEFEVDEDIFDDNIFNTKKRELTIQLTGGGNAQVQVNKTAEFTYQVQDDEGIYGEWELDHTDPVAFAKFKQLFGLINEDIKNLQVADVKEITLEYEFEEIKAVVVLKATEQVDDCGKIKTENKVIEVEAEIEDLDDDKTEGDIEFGETLELDNGRFKEYVYAGSFKIVANKLTLELEGELDDDKTGTVILTLEK